jgi:hypothetical protein
MRLLTQRLVFICGLLSAVLLLPNSLLTAEAIRILSVRPTPEPETVAATVQVPRTGQVLKGAPIWVQVRLNGYALGSDSQFDRSSEVSNSDNGQMIRVVVDDFPSFSTNGPSIEPFNEDGWYYDQSYKFKVPYKLSPGLHVLRVFPVRSFGESLKGERAFHAIYFYVGNERGDEEREGMLSKPYLTYNEPSGQVPLREGMPVLLDFYISNCELTPDGYKIRMSIDGAIQRLLTSWNPYYIYGLKKGKHTIHLELINEQNQPVQGVPPVPD